MREIIIVLCVCSAVHLVEGCREVSTHTGEASSNVQTAPTITSETQTPTEARTEHVTKRDVQNEKDTRISVSTENAQDAESIPREQLIPTVALEPILGEWFAVRNVARGAAKAATNWISFEFRQDKTVTRRHSTGDKVTTQEGTWDYGQFWVVEARFDLGHAGVQVWTWRPTPSGKATIVRWRNLTKGYGRNENEVYVRKGSEEWTRGIHTPAHHPENSSRAQYDLASAIGAVKWTMTVVDQSKCTYETGYLKEGVGVLVDEMAAYYVRGGVVYAANGFAKMWSPSIPYIRDPAISFHSIQRAVSKKRE